MSALRGGDILMMRGNHTQKTSIDREKGFLAEIRKSDQFNISSYLSGYWEIEPAFNAISTYMKTSHKMPDAVFAYSDSMAIGVSRYFQSKGFKQRPLIVGVDGVLLGQQAVLEGRIDASVVQAPEVMGETALNELTKCIHGKQTESAVRLTPVTLLKANRTLEVVNP
jgi:ribose transport system substrate-binding protein